MGQILHGSAATTEAVRRAIQNSEESLRALVKEEWRAELFPAEQACIVQCLIERVVVNEDGLGIKLRTSGIRSLIEDLRPGRQSDQEAA